MFRLPPTTGQAGVYDEDGHFVTDAESRKELNLAIAGLDRRIRRQPVYIQDSTGGRRRIAAARYWLQNGLFLSEELALYYPMTAEQHARTRRMMTRLRATTTELRDEHEKEIMFRRQTRMPRTSPSRRSSQNSTYSHENPGASYKSRPPTFSDASGQGCRSYLPTNGSALNCANHSPIREPRIDVQVERDGVTTMLGAGESYRPNNPNHRARTPPRADTYRSDRDRSPRRARSPPVTDSYYPNSRDRSPRRTSPLRRSPPRDHWRANRSPPRRPRSPPRRYSPRRDDDRRERARSPRNDRRRSRSPYNRDRAPPRTRSPFRRSPPAGPRGSYRSRSRSVDRRDGIPTGPTASNFRRNSPSPPRDSGRSSVRTSGSNSRRSSPHVHPSRLATVQQASRPRSPPMTRDRSPPSHLPYRDRDPLRSTTRERSPPRPKSPPRGPATFRPPIGPSGSRSFASPSSTTSASATQVSTSAHNRSDNAPVGPPAGPRAQFSPSIRGGYTRGGRGGFGTDRRSLVPSTPSRPSNEFASRSMRPVDPVSHPSPISPSLSTEPSSSIPTGPSGGIPTGPRAGGGITSRPSLQHSSSVYGSRSHIAASSGLRPHPAMANMPQIIPGGRIDPTASGMSPETTMRIKKREDDEAVQRADLSTKQDVLRKNMREYERMKSESTQWALRSELSSKHLSALVGDGVGGPAF